MPRLRLNRAQWSLAGVLGLLLLALVVLSFQASAQQREHTESLARTEAGEHERRLHPARDPHLHRHRRALPARRRPRREVQVARALLGHAWTSSAPTVSPPDRPRPRRYQAAPATWMRRSSNLPAGVIPDEQRKPSGGHAATQARGADRADPRMWSRPRRACTGRAGSATGAAAAGRRIQIVPDPRRSDSRHGAAAG